MSARGLLAGCAACAAAVALAAPAAAVAAPPPAALDPAFGTDGVAPVSTDPGVSAWDIAATPDGGVAALGWIRVAEAGGRVTKLTAAGVPDVAFGGGDGVAEVRFGAPHDGSFETIAVDGRGRLLVGGVVGLNGAADAMLARLLPDGSLDPSFDGDGLLRLRLAPTASDSFTRRLELAPDGRIFVLGSWRAAPDPTINEAIAVLDDSGAQLVAPRTWRSGTAVAAEAAAVTGDQLALLGNDGGQALVSTRSATTLDPQPGFPNPLRFNPIAGLSSAGAADALVRADGGALVVGSAYDQLTGVAHGLTFTSGSGGVAGHHLIDPPAGRSGLALDTLGADRDGRPLAGGYTYGIGDDDRPVVVALDADGAVDAARGGVQPIDLPAWIERPDAASFAFDRFGDAFALVHYRDASNFNWSLIARIDAVPDEQPPTREPEPEPEPEPQPGPQPGPGPGPGPQPGPVPQPGPGPEPQPRPSTRPQPRPTPRAAVRAPRVRIAPVPARGAIRSLGGTVGGGARQVRVALAWHQPGGGIRRCLLLTSRKPAFSRPRRCAPVAGVTVSATRAGRWTLRFSGDRLPAGRYTAWAWTPPRRGVLARPFSARAGNTIAFTVKQVAGAPRGDDDPTTPTPCHC